MKIVFIVSLLFLSIDLSAQYKSDFLVNDDISGSMQNYPLCDANNSSYVVIWKDHRETYLYRSYIYFQVFNRNGQFLGANKRANVSGDSNITNHTLKMRNDNSFIIGWSSFTANELERGFVFKIFSNNGDSISNLITINDSVYYTSSNARGLSIDTDINNNIYTAFCYSLSPVIPYNIYFQKFNSSGIRIGSRVLVNDDINNSIQVMPVIKVRRDGSYIVVWMDKRDSNTGAGNIYMQMFDVNGNRVGNNRRINDDDPVNTHHEYPDIACDSSGNFVVVWQDLRINDIDYNIFAQAFNTDGQPVGANFKVDEGLTLWNRYYPKIAMNNNGNYVITWNTDDGPDPTTNYFRRYSNLNQSIGSQRKISSQSPSDTKTLPDVSISGDRMYFAWLDSRNVNEDIYSNILSFQNPDSAVNSVVFQNNILPAAYKLSQNYPNPFNPVTKIGFEIPKSGLVKISIYDITGKKISSLVNEHLNPGSYETIWNGDNHSSGVYYYTIQVNDFAETRKMLMVK